MVSKSPRSTTLFNEPNDNHRNLVIVVSAVFGSLALFMVVSATVFVIRWKRNPKYHRNRGNSPVDDEEIERWRGRKETYTEAPGRNTPNPKQHKRQSSSVVIVSHPPGWTWNAEPSPFGSRNSGETALSPPPMVARAPNSRSGLTDGAILGADPFVPPVRRQSTRLAKHGRNQSRKSSFSASIPERPSTDVPRHYRDDSKKSFQAEHVSPPSSIFNGSPGGNEPLPSFSRPAYGRAPSSRSMAHIHTSSRPSNTGSLCTCTYNARRTRLPASFTRAARNTLTMDVFEGRAPPFPTFQTQANNPPRLPRRHINPLLRPLTRHIPHPPLHQLGALPPPPPPAPLAPPTKQRRARLPRPRVFGRAAGYIVSVDAGYGFHAENGCVWSEDDIWIGVLWRDCGGGHDGLSEGRGEDGE
ncbi:hypothetical protein V495_08496 [Pseudogymnoascus sp. VKM F-4514 (FW-929)]|nr:hypothetical protein V495_08496 [Pseudogymnoascus sp. VKM F-4514 (FW-929)]